MNWNTDTYSDFLIQLKELADSNYQIFQQKLIPNSVPILGVRTPILKKIAKAIAKGNYQDFFTYNTHQTYEEILIHGFVLGYLKLEFKDLLLFLEDWFSYNTNWATTDLVCANLKQWKHHLEEGLLSIQKYLHSNNSWTVRFGLVLLLTYYLDTDIDLLLKISKSVTCQEYYVKMANAWLLSYCYIKDPKKTYQFLSKNDLDTFTHNKTIQKIIESTQVSLTQKIEIKALKR